MTVFLLPVVLTFYSGSLSTPSDFRLSHTRYYSYFLYTWHPCFSSAFNLGPLFALFCRQLSFQPPPPPTHTFDLRTNLLQVQCGLISGFSPLHIVDFQFLCKVFLFHPYLLPSPSHSLPMPYNRLLPFPSPSLPVASPATFFSSHHHCRWCQSIVVHSQ